MGGHLRHDPCLETLPRPQVVSGDRIRVVEILATGTSGGAQEHVFGLVSRMDQARFDVSVVSLSPGSTVRKLERAGFDKEVTAAGLLAVRRIAAEITPLLGDLPAAASWAGLRPGTPDRLPVVGPGALAGLFHATGLYRNGILLGPLVGEAVARLARGLAAEIDLSAFSPARFDRRA